MSNKNIDDIPLAEQVATVSRRGFLKLAGASGLATAAADDDAAGDADDDSSALLTVSSLTVSPLCAAASSGCLVPMACCSLAEVTSTAAMI